MEAKMHSDCTFTPARGTAHGNSLRTTLTKIQQQEKSMKKVTLQESVSDYTC